MSALDEPSEAPRFVCTKTIAHRGSFDPDTMRKLRRTGGGPPYVRRGRSIRYDVQEFDAWMKEQTFRSQADELARGQEEGS
jgi:Helix-turn-helix domain